MSWPPVIALLSLVCGTALAADEYQMIPFSVPTTGHAGFALLNAPEIGISFTNVLSVERYTTNQIYLNGSGVAAADVNGDGLCDLFFAGVSGTSALFQNLGGMRFRNVTTSAIPSLNNISATGAAFADFDGDGNVDLVLNSVGDGTHIFFNDGKGHFVRKQVLNEGKAGMSLAIADYNGDGSLDLYICNYRTTTLRDLPNTNFRINMVSGQPVVAAVNGEPTTLPKFEGRYALNSSGGIAEFGEPDALYRNDGKGHFSRVSFTDGTFLDERGDALRAPPYDWSLSAMFRDLNGDGLPDLYVCSDFDTPDRLWLNQGNGTFRAAGPLVLRNTSRFSMGIDVADINRDGHDEFFVLDMLSRQHVTRLTRADKNMDSGMGLVFGSRPQFGRNTLQLARPDGTFSEIAFFAGLEASEWSWTPIFLDVDLDGYEDLLITTGHARDDMDIDNGLRIERARRIAKMAPAAELALRKTSPPLPSKLLAFRNTGHLTFEEAGNRWGFDRVGIAHGMCLADLDNDGDLDVVVNNLNAAPSIYRNESSAPRIAVRLRSTRGNRQGIGARIIASGGAVPLQTQSIICGGRYLSSDEPLRTFSAGSVSNRLTIEVEWPGGRKSVVQNVMANTRVEVNEEGSAVQAISKGADVTALFEDASRLLNHRHEEDPFDDFARQALLPKMLSRLGPGVAWADLNGDGREDLIIGTGKGGKIAAYQMSDLGKFTIGDYSELTRPASRDTAGIVASSKSIFVSYSNYEDSQTNGAAIIEYPFVTGNARTVASLGSFSAGALALSDVDADGNLELFAAGRTSSAGYPAAASSFLYQQTAQRWRERFKFKDVGLVSGAVFTDLNGDGFPELVLACEWGPIKVFRNDHGRFEEATASLGLQTQVGWWNGVVAGDFDNDGRMDLIASNWGLNSKYRVVNGNGPRIYWEHWGGAGEIEPIEAEYDSALHDWFPLRDLNTMGRAIPELREAFRTHRAFAQAPLSRIFGERLKNAGMYEVKVLESTVYLNRGDHFEPRPLPPEAQFSPGFGISVADFDGDGNEDLFLAQNFFDVAATTSRSDAGRGLLLQGKGNGDFEPIDGAQSGIKVYGEQRGCAVADYDADGRVDLAVAQNGAASTLWHNTGAKPGLRVLLKGDASIGAVIRIVYADGSSGPAREIHAGSGYWSQDSLTQVLALRAVPAQLSIVWPGGRKTLVAIPPNSRDIVVNSSGTLLTR